MSERHRNLVGASSNMVQLRTRGGCREEQRTHRQDPASETIRHLLVGLEGEGRGGIAGGERGSEVHLRQIVNERILEDSRFPFDGILWYFIPSFA